MRSPRRALAALRGRSLRARMVLVHSLTLAAVCTAMAVATVLVQRSYLIRDLDQRVTDAAEHSQGGREHGPPGASLGFLNERGQHTGTLAALMDGNRISTAEVVTDDGPRTLTAAQRAALAGIPADGTLRTRTIPGLGAYRLTAVTEGGTTMLAGLPVGSVQQMIDSLVGVEAGIAGIGLVLAGSVSAMAVRRQLRPLRRVATTAVEVSRAPLDRGEVTGLTRVPAPDTDPRTEVGQVGVALNRLIDHVEWSLCARQRAEEQMRRFLADASHELRTPLASIAGYAELMLMGVDAHKIEPDLAWRRVSAQSARMTGLVEDLLLLARLEEGRPLESAEVNLATLVGDAVWDARAAGSGHHWQLVLRLDAPATVLGDTARLHQVVANLLANARTHTPTGTRVTVTVETADAHCVIRVHDDGPGIPPDLLPTVFERFTRGDASRSRTPGTAGGAGLGLAIAAAITQAHGGRVEVTGAPGGTEFTVTLPLAPSAAHLTLRLS
ncbi:sensor histidine kinase [Streptomyces arenae]|uniref:sensor histidine kinase n=1 Tax=Streptomyces arenae TaxID=29301 RepID=UPI00265889B8|nr:ATP-binding protein [Streptomyces arenae]MCG7208384.1 HAMP domain-containing histidine kinase [Streptomyces arenae]